MPQPAPHREALSHRHVPILDAGVERIGHYPRSGAQIDENKEEWPRAAVMNHDLTLKFLMNWLILKREHMLVLSRCHIQLYAVFLHPCEGNCKISASVTKAFRVQGGAKSWMWTFSLKSFPFLFQIRWINWSFVDRLVDGRKIRENAWSSYEWQFHIYLHYCMQLFPIWLMYPTFSVLTNN